MPRHTPDHLIVRLVNLVEHLAGRRTPVDNLAIACRIWRTCKQVLLKWVPGNNINRVIVLFEAVKLLLRLANIIYFDLMVSGASEEPIAIDRVPPCLCHCVIMCLNCVDSFAAGPRIPHLHIIILTTCDDQWLKGMPVACFNVRPMVLKRKFLLTRWKVKHFGRVIVCTRDEFQWGVAEGQITNARLYVRDKLVLLLQL